MRDLLSLVLLPICPDTPSQALQESDDVIFQQAVTEILVPGKRIGLAKDQVPSLG
jgi:hypothetical protein